MNYVGALMMALAVMTTTPPAIAQAGQGAEKSKVKKTCRSLTPTGSFLPTRVCNTEAEWQKFDNIGQEGVGEFRRALNMTSTNERNRRN
ncbi:hypothetical protein NS355_00250 [Sphingomonas yabuuchiae]|uniref:Uncharacterized protein n=1 Tax=Sphingomonas yabuuchiae TaxID=172044 RepID=A0A147J058_9SPHN|nr:hypothetical protein [Sphingomonas yabuuchiae]KTW01524.1 hypothetical protein NS355_00250 [Sphingomonas yabuuchiae]